MLNNILQQLQQLQQLFAGRNGGGMGMLGQGGGMMPAIPGQMPPGFGGAPSFLDGLFANKPTPMPAPPASTDEPGGMPTPGGELPPYRPPSRGNEGLPTGVGGPQIMEPWARPGSGVAQTKPGSGIPMIGVGGSSSISNTPRPTPGGSSPGMSGSPGMRPGTYTNYKPMPRGGL